MLFIDEKRKMVKRERGKNERKKMRYYGKKREKMGKYVRDRERVLDI